MRIACRECEMYRTQHCDDCLVTAMLHPPQDEVDIDEDLEGSLGALAEAGLIPVLRFSPKAPPGPARGARARPAHAGSDPSHGGPGPGSIRGQDGDEAAAS